MKSAGGADRRALRTAAQSAFQGDQSPPAGAEQSLRRHGARAAECTPASAPSRRRPPLTAAAAHTALCRLFFSF
jgi:hypothetical protein